MSKVMARQDLYAFVWRALLKYTKEEIVAFRLRYDNPVDWAFDYTDLKERVPMTALAEIDSLRREMPSWGWDPLMNCPHDIFTGLANIQMEFVLKNDVYPWAV